MLPVVWLIACYVFLYAPIGFLIVFSFNDSRLLTGWSGFSTRWYATLWHDQTLIDATFLSLRIAVVSATIASLIGTAAGFVLARYGRFRGRGLFATALVAPLVIPEVITGLSLLLLFVTLEQLTGWPRGPRRRHRNAGARLGLCCLCRGRRARPARGCRRVVLEQAAMDLYATALESLCADHAAPDGAGAGVWLAARLHLVDGRRRGGKLHLRARRLHAADGRVFRDQVGRDPRDLRSGHCHRRRRGHGAAGGLPVVAAPVVAAPVIDDRSDTNAPLKRAPEPLHQRGACPSSDQHGKHTPEPIRRSSPPGAPGVVVARAVLRPR